MSIDDKQAASLFRLLELGPLVLRYAQLQVKVLRLKGKRATKRLALAVILTVASLCLLVLCLGAGMAALVMGLHAAGYSLPYALGMTDAIGLAVALVSLAWARSLCRRLFDL